MKRLNIVHIDMDAFYASVEQRDNPEYRNRPLIVGGDPNGRGVVSTVSYEGRKFGIHSAMSCAMAKRLCPNAIFVRANMKKYKAVSNQIHNIFSKYTDIIEPISLDEAFLDLSGQDAVQIAKMIKNDIYKVTKLTASVGISYNKFLAKLASDMQKPDGFTVITKNYAEKLLPTLAVRKLWGVGNKTEKELRELGIITVSDLLNYDRHIIIDKYGKKGYELLQYAKGIDYRPVQAKTDIKSLGEETTLAEDTKDYKVLQSYLKEFSHQIYNRMKMRKLECRTITVKIKYEDFKVITRSTTHNRPICQEQIFYKIAVDILKRRVVLDKKVRLIGMQVSNIIHPGQPVQLEFKLD